MGGVPDAIFVVDVGYHKGAITEAAKLGIPVIGVVDTNHSPEGVATSFLVMMTHPRQLLCMPAVLLMQFWKAVQTQ
jgi:hypothetical protein